MRNNGNHSQCVIVRASIYKVKKVTWLHVYLVCLFVSRSLTLVRFGQLLR